MVSEHYYTAVVAIVIWSYNTKSYILKSADDDVAGRAGKVVGGGAQQRQDADLSDEAVPRQEQAHGRTQARLKYARWVSSLEEGVIRNSGRGRTYVLKVNLGM